MNSKITFLFILFCFSVSLIFAENIDTLINNRKSVINKTLSKKNPIYYIDQNSLKGNNAAIELLSNHPQIQRSFFDNNGNPMFNEVFGIYPALKSDISQDVTYIDGVLRIEIYNFALNMSLISFVDIVHNQVLKVNIYPNSQPDIPEYLKQLAITIAVNADEVKKAFPDLNEKSNVHPLMAGTKTSLNKSKCERSRHLCVAPTFVKEEKALWTIVDLTDLTLVGTRWTTVGNSQPLTERRYQNEKMNECYCYKDSTIVKGDWGFTYTLTSSDGILVSDVYFKNKKIINSAKLVDIHVSYSGTDGFGYSDAVGCPIFSEAAVLAIKPPVLSILKSEKDPGFVLEQQYFSEGWPAPCNYNYVQRFEFYDDGSFRMAFGSLGRGCGTDGTYRPVSRIAFSGNQNNFFEWKGNKWNLWKNEKWALQSYTTNYYKEFLQYKIVNNEKSGFYVMANVGQMYDGGKGDNAFIYITKWNANLDEGDSDLITLGPCCNTNHHQGPEKFINDLPERIDNSAFVFWYVPQLKNNGNRGEEYCWANSFIQDGLVKAKAYPCMSGPKFIPIKK